MYSSRNPQKTLNKSFSIFNKHMKDDIIVIETILEIASILIIFSTHFYK